MPIVATVSETAGVAHMLGTDAVVLDTDTIGVGVQWSETSNSDDFAKNLIQARCEVRDLGAEPVGRRLLRFDGLTDPRSGLFLGSARYGTTPRRHRCGRVASSRPTGPKKPQ